MSTWRQSQACMRAEWLRLLTTPTWSILLILWTLVCSLYFQVVIHHASANQLPPGETPLTFFYRWFPGLLSLLLVCFIPQLTMDAVAGRRERNRLEHLLAAGIRPSSLIVGSFGALAAMLALLLIPPFLLNCILIGQGSFDLGPMIGGLCAIYSESLLIGSLGLAISCWCSSRLVAGLIALSVGMSWWIIDVFAPVLLISSEQYGQAWYQLLGLAEPIHHFAGGIIHLGQMAAFFTATMTCLALGRLGLQYPHHPQQRFVCVGLTIALAYVCLRLCSWWQSDIDVTNQHLHALDPALQQLLTELPAEQKLTVTLIASPSMRSHLIDGPLLERVENILGKISQQKFRQRQINPSNNPRLATALSHQHHLTRADLQHPTLIVETAQRAVVIRRNQLGTIEQRDGEGEVLVGFSCQQAFFHGLQEALGHQRYTVAWWATDLTRPLQPQRVVEQQQSVQKWQQSWLDCGAHITPLQSWQGLSPLAIVVLAGPYRDISQEAFTALQQHLDQGGRLCLALDGQNPQELPLLARLLQPYGINWSESNVATVQGWHGDQPELLPLVEIKSADDQGPTALASRDGRRLALPYPIPLQADLSNDDIEVKTYLPSPRASYLYHRYARPQLLPGSRPLLITAEKGDQRIAVLGSCDALANDTIQSGGNKLLSYGLYQWLSTRSNEQSVIAIKEVVSRQVQLSAGAYFLATWIVGGGLPIAAAGIGCFIWYRRRRQ